MDTLYKILIVEDDPDFNGFLQNLLSIKGYEVLAANNGVEAHKYFGEYKIDLAILDVQLPDTDGYQILDRVRTEFPDSMVIMMTGHASIDSAVKALKKGAYDYLEKPFATEKLLNTIQNALERKRLETRSKRALEKLKESEEKYHHLFDSVTDALMIVDAESRKFEDANAAALTLFGYSLEEFCNLQVEEISAEKDKTLNTFERVKMGEQGSRFVPMRYLRKKNGTKFPGEISTASFTSGGRQKIIGSIRDITERQRTMEKLRTAQKHLQHVLSSSSSVIYTIDPNSDFAATFVSDSVKTVLGYEPQEYIDDPKFWVDRIHPDDARNMMGWISNLMESGRQVSEYRFRHKNGSYRWLHDELRMIYDGQGAPEEVVGNSIDITEAKKLEQQLIIKNKMLSLGRVAAGIAHEIRNPLTGINSYLFTIADLCRKEAFESEDIAMMQQIVEQIQVASNKIESVIKRVMDFSKPGAPKMVLSDINESLEEAMKLSLVILRKSDIKLEKELAQNLPQCYIDPHLIEQVLLNLITNAAKALQNGDGPKTKIIEVKTYSKNNSVSIGVSDSGPGVPRKLRDKIFDPFFTTREDGQGIGLNIAQRIVADHNGSLTLDTSKWGGAEFRIELPVEKRMDPR